MNVDNHITKQSQISDSPYYVLATDTFLSDWGPATGKDNVLVFVAKNRQQASIIKIRLQARDEMKRVRINVTKPRLSESWYVQLFTEETYLSWYKEV